MLKTALLLLLASVSCSAMAAWVTVGSNETFVVYAEPGSRGKEGDMARIWVLYNYKSAQVTAGQSWISVKTQYECACKGNQMRQLSYSFYSETMGDGKVVYSRSEPGKWISVKSGSMIDGLLKIACETQSADKGGSSEAAKWVKVGSSENEPVARYADPDTIVRDGSRATMWGLLDFKTVQTSPASMSFLSMKLQYEYDCNKVQARKLSHGFYSENMGGGEVVYIDSDPDGWKPVDPGSIRETMWEFACRSGSG